ncbi:sigma 54-interacting transcriptional regulator [Paraglaciecola aquimarina]|uniref:HTH-type transcriptional regulatory protein TyrR n=1 Tax=Paraglaciecola algarum TaxID=3050085 RepID=A0ABS9D1V5_9ALTE|nr:sigma 54-interacting transcriptional regulator [Paraglaciecola sp. G1-23]MCF2946880.1 sigma 54-interacting transcriptional regulator [Paraglaciecola sp. G1-23]
MRLEVSCKDRLGITQDVLDILLEYEIDLRGIEIDEAGKIFLNFPNIEFEEFQHLMPKLRLLNGIEDVKTTPFMPTEREQYQLQALLKTLPEPVFSVDAKGKIILVNDQVLSNLSVVKEDLIGSDITEVLKGFNILKWLETKPSESNAQRVRFLEQDYLLDMLPVKVPNSDGTDVFAGAVFLLKSEFRLGQQLSVFQQTIADSFVSIQTNSKAMKQLVKDAKRMAELDNPILIFGETGSGKRAIANACQKASRRQGKVYLSLNCIGLSEEQAQTALFGSSNVSDNTGLLQGARNGTILLEEVGELPIRTQAKLLRIITSEQSFNIRILATTQKDLGLLMEQGLFRQDLFYYLSELSLVLPPLRERKADIPPLMDKFIQQYCFQLGRKPPQMTKSCIEYLQTYPWPGNVKQCKHALYKALTLLEGDELTKVDFKLPTSVQTNSVIADEFEGSLDEEVKRFEKDILMRLYPIYPSSRQLAKKLGLSHTAIANKLRDYGINKKSP